ncbi:hypothetical protein FRX31_005041, partial [Thalictrum thalictroides]
MWAKLAFNNICFDTEESGSSMDLETSGMGMNQAQAQSLDHFGPELGLPQNFFLTSQQHVGPLTMGTKGPPQPRPSSHLLGIQINEPEVTATILRCRRAQILTEKKCQKGKLKISYQMEEQTTSNKKRKSDEMNLIQYKATNGDELSQTNLQEIAAMWENVTNPKMINLLIANGLNLFGGTKHHKMDSIVEESDCGINNYEVALSYGLTMHPLAGFREETGFITHAVDGSAELHSNTFHPQIDLGPVIECNIPKLPPSISNIDNQ